MQKIAVLLAVAAIAGTTGCKKTEPTQGAAPASGIVAVKADEKGFTPASITLKKGANATLRFTRTTTETCAEKVVFPELKLEKDLPLNTAVDIPVETKEARTLNFQCGMGMFKSKVVIE